MFFDGFGGFQWVTVSPRGRGHTPGILRVGEGRAVFTEEWPVTGHECLHCSHLFLENKWSTSCTTDTRELILYHQIGVSTVNHETRPRASLEQFNCPRYFKPVHSRCLPLAFKHFLVLRNATIVQWMAILHMSYRFTLTHSSLGFVIGGIKWGSRVSSLRRQLVMLEMLGQRDNFVHVCWTDQDGNTREQVARTELDAVDGEWDGKTRADPGE